MKGKRSLTYVGAFVSALAIFLAWQNQKPETKSIKPQTQLPLVSTSKQRLVTPKKKDSEKDPNEFIIETSVSIGASNQTTN